MPSPAALARQSEAPSMKRPPTAATAIRQQQRSDGEEAGALSTAVAGPQVTTAGANPRAAPRGPKSRPAGDLPGAQSVAILSWAAPAPPVRLVSRRAFFLEMPRAAMEARFCTAWSFSLRRLLAVLGRAKALENFGRSRLIVAQWPFPMAAGPGTSRLLLGDAP
eukprot:CAMPEP_0206007354 /NCGR_PEP_ID=MMETSP1464-20131121/5719_1 /ASSEMBLY_ACC=CAM_ASM_001124 /TAXON_ID=119497 /ORGANISM="Exanthemachrysis gayraliae, Strain RCC1523" /LENGTH=163 /DNA_ID=CAMNT_0053380849 /DNA_START=278 /DNA_END=766 /DNA_ORIENTATION=-